MYKESLFKKLASLATLVAVMFWLVGSTGVQFAYAAQLTNLSDTLSNATASTASNHTIVFTTPTGTGNNKTIQITFTGYADLGQIGTSSIDILVGNSTTTATQQEVASSSNAGAGVWGFATSSNVLTLTSPTSGSAPTAGQVVIIKIGTNATSSQQGTQQITNPGAGSYAIDIAGSQPDSGSITVTIIPNSTVSASATITQSLSFSISTTTIYYGNLSSSFVKFASSTNSSGDTASTTAHNLQVSTNAPSGYVITLQGDTLRNQNATSSFINAIGSTPSASLAGTNQFGINASASGGTGGTVMSTYGTANQYGFGASTSTADTLAYGNVPTTTTTYNLQYIANIIATQSAGTYTTAITYVATSNF